MVLQYNKKKEMLNRVRQASDISQEINDLIEFIFKNSDIKQFTIDIIEYTRNEIECFIMGDSAVSDFKILLGNLSYSASTALEICDKELRDYSILQKLYQILNSEE